MKNAQPVLATYLDTEKARYAFKAMPSREELLKRNSFPGPDQNRHIDRFLREYKEDQK